MTIGIMVAMKKELNLLLPLLDNRNKVEVCGNVFHTGVIRGREVVVMQCGIGKVNAAIGASAMIDRFAPSMIINTGVAGGTGAGAKVLDVVVAERMAYHDVWCGPGCEWGQVEGLPMYFDSDSSVLDMKCLDKHGVKRGLICSGDIFVSKEEDLARIKSLFPEVMAVDMESAPIAHACYLRKVPFVSLRVISDTPGEEDNISQYADFWNDAPQNTFTVLNTIISNLDA